MASRYQNNETKVTNDGRTVYRSKIYPEIPLRDTDIYVATETFHLFSQLAYHCLSYTSPSPREPSASRMRSSSGKKKKKKNPSPPPPSNPPLSPENTDIKKQNTRSQSHQ